MRAYSLKDLLPSKDLEQIKSTISDFPEFKGQFVGQSISYGEYYHDVSNGCIKRLRKGDVIGSVLFSKPFVGHLIKSLEFAPIIIAPEDAYYFLPKLEISSVSVLLDKAIVLCILFESNDEIAKFYIDDGFNYKISNDLFTNEKTIVWNSFRLDYSGSGRNPYIILQNKKEQFIFEYHKKEFSTHKFQKGDGFHFVFSNGIHLEYLLKASPTNTKDPDFKQVSFSLLPQDVKLFATELVIAIRCTFANGDAPLDLKPKNELASLTLKLYFQKFKQALLECGVDIEMKLPDDKVLKNENEAKEQPVWKESACFVYLMKDESNGFYKIGISNKPEYRERTLQSEKPTIILIKSKEFPTRIITEAIESALHKAFGDKRLRGEWFELDSKDVDDIIITLS